ncbi:helix-turn-helix domain-containing protein [Streptosporangium amethystogenes]|uniref:helix-turn-helix domain-containing protein n=1 Tax=Streptosporangium amethystogenes TaxID=2002 RepID=UPI0004CA0195|nr:helix-turn-helix transcriptional regulator [Streptosporangium amethystogenes]
MPDTIPHAQPGDRIRTLRGRRGWTQEELAAASGLSTAVIKKVEQGGTARMETYHTIATALGVVTMTFVSPGPPDPVLNGPNEMVLAPLRAAVAPAMNLAGQPMYGTADAEEISLPRLEKAVSSLGAIYHSNRYDDLAALLPPLILSSQYHVTHLEGDPEQQEALRLRADGLNLAARYLIQVRAHDLALIAIQGSQRDALAIGDMQLAGAAVSVQAWAMMRQGRFREVMDLCLHAAETIEPRMSSATHTQLEAWGWLLARASAAAARNNQPVEAEEYASLAGLAGTRMGREYKRSAGRSFGPLTAALIKTENAMIAGDPARAVALYEVLPRGVGRTDNSTWNRALLDAARANARTGDVARATEIMTKLRIEAPEWLRYQQLGQDATREIVSIVRRKLNPNQKALVAFYNLTD